ncbi:MAG: baseplate J/gp47 family protein [Caenibius sp.]
MSISEPLLAIDLSRLPAPQVPASIDFETILADCIAGLQERLPDYDLALESDPAVKLLEVHGWRELLVRQAIADAVKSVLLPFTQGAMLDQLAGFHNLPRRIITPATDDTPAVMESDDEFRARIQIAPETLPHAGITAAGYRARALALSAELKDVAANRRGQGRIDLVLLGRNDDGEVSAGTVALVAEEMDREDVIQLTDVLSVRGATILPYDVSIELRIGQGPDPALIVAEAETAVRAYAARRHRIGLPVYAQQLAAAASVGGVEHAVIAMADVIPGDAEAAWLRDLVITTW